MSKAAKYAVKEVVKTADEVLGEIIPVKEIARAMDDGVKPMEKAIRKIELKGALGDDDGDGIGNWEDEDAIYSRTTAAKSVASWIWDWLFGDNTSDD